MKILLTGFEPFGGDATNPSWEAVSRLPDTVGGCEIVTRRMPVEYDAVAPLLRKAMNEEQPDAVICVGQAGGRTCLTPEMVAINLNDAGIPDNAGVSHGGEPIVAGAPAAYFTTLPVKRMAAAANAAGVPASVSYTAGTYVCNNIFYHLMHTLAEEHSAALGGFIHIPFSTDQAALRTGARPASLPLPLMADGLAAMLEALADTLRTGKQDLREGTGTTH